MKLVASAEEEQNYTYATGPLVYKKIMNKHNEEGQNHRAEDIHFQLHGQNSSTNFQLSDRTQHRTQHRDTRW